MPARVVIGAQWGDEGKGAVVDRESDKADAVVRFNGGANAGHTLEVDGEQFITHLCPSGIIRRKKINLIGPGVVCDPVALEEELKIADRFEAVVNIDRSAPLILPIHKEIDAGRESASGSVAIGTTKRGIGPGYEDFWARRCVRAGDLVSEDRVVRALRDRGYYEERRVVAAHLGAAAPTLDETVEWCMQYSDLFKPRLCDTRAVVHNLLRQDRNVLFEGAQGVMLDTIFGSQPYTTSSLCTAACISATFGVYKFEKVIGIVKAYLTRVGAGPFPTEDEGALGKTLRDRGKEYGATTGRPRRCGWLDLVALRYACRMGGITNLYVTKLDVLSTMLLPQFATQYVFEGKVLDEDDTLTNRVLTDSVPTYETGSEGWMNDISTCRSWDDLPSEAQLYLERISSYVGLPITGIGVGPGRDQSIWVG